MDEKRIYRDFEFAWDERKILIRLGAKAAPGPVSPVLAETVAAVKSDVASYLEPAAALSVIPASETNGHPIFAGAVEVALGVLTIGSRLEEECEREFRGGDMLRGLVLDAFGSLAVVQVFRPLERLLVAEALGRGLWPSRRFSPGYKGWPLEEQRFLFSKVDAGAIGVRLNDSCMMVPRKSNSFRINFYADRALTTRRLPDSPG
jgi:hypothetical protein